MLTTGSILNPGSIYSQQPQFCTLDFYHYFMFLGMYCTFCCNIQHLILFVIYSVERGISQYRIAFEVEHQMEIAGAIVEDWTRGYAKAMEAFALHCK